MYNLQFVNFSLCNFCMSKFSEYISNFLNSLGSYFGLSMLTAAAFGNTISDSIGIGSAYYVERFANRIGYKPPTLTMKQLDMPISRRVINIGRVTGIIIGCLIGMFPLLFICK